MPNRPRVIAPGYPHHVVARANGGLTVFRDEKDFLSFLQITKALRKRRKVKIWAFCLMSNHVHLLVVPETPEDMIKFLQGTLVRYTQYYHEKYQTEGNLWRTRYFASIVDQNSYLWKVMRYIERNPVRAGLVDHPESYPYSSASKNRIGSYFSDPPPFSEEILEFYKEWRNKDESPELIEFLRKSTRKNWPIGDESFRKRFGIVSRTRGRPPKNRI